MVSQKYFRFTPSLLDLPILSFMFICLLSLFWSVSFFVSLKELPLFLVGPCLYFIITNNITEELQIKRFLKILLIVSSLLGIYGIMQYLGIDFFLKLTNLGRNRVYGLFGNVNYFAEYLIIPLPITVAHFFASQNKMEKILLSIGVLAMGGALVLTFTRGSYLGMGVSLIFMFLLFHNTRGKDFIKQNKKILIILLVLIIIITFLFVVSTPLSKSGTIISKIKSRISVSQLTQSSSIKRRMATWNFTTMMIKDHPLLGSGIGTFKYNSLSYQARFFDQGQNRAIYPYGIAGKAHNEYLQLWAELGIIGLGIFIWLIITYFGYGLKLLKKLKDGYKQGIIIGLMGSITAVLVDALFGFPLHLPASVVLFWLVLGLTVVVGTTENIYFGKADLTSEDSDKTEKQEKKKKAQRRNSGKIKKSESNIFYSKYLLYITIILFSVFLSITLSRPFIAKVYYKSGSIEMRKDSNRAIDYYKKALKWDPYYGEAYYSIGKILEYKKLYTLAGEYYEKSEIYFDFPYLPQSLAAVYLHQDMQDKAVIRLKQAISYQRNEKSMVPLYSQLGDIYLYQKKYKLAEEAFKNILEMDSDFVNAHYRLANIYLKQDKQIEALREFKKVIELAPDSEAAKYSKIMIQKINKN
jgi:O-antigen ligase